MDDTKQPVVFLCNHRSWGDFWVDVAILGGPSTVSRWMVALGIPLSAAWGFLAGFVWFFNRAKKRVGGTVKWMCNFYQESHNRLPYKGMIVFPEGTRNLSPEGEALRPGGLAAMHTLGWPCQVVITTHKEDVMLERELRMGRRGVRVNTSVGKPVWPKDFSTADDFIAEVTKNWRATYDDAIATDTSGVPRPRALLPGCVARDYLTLSVPGNSNTNKVRAFVAVLALLVAYYMRR